MNRDDFTLHFRRAEGLLEDALVILRMCLAEGYEPYDEHEEEIYILCQAAERIATEQLGLDVKHYPHCHHDGIHDLMEQIHEAALEEGYDMWDL
tara:strand:+ start:1841 stop:2122 length:282 start_codon:yes stop_codon:yes gene_type:complete